MAGSVQASNALAELRAQTRRSEDPDFDQSMEVGDRNARGGSGSSDGGQMPQGEEQQQAPRPRPMPALGGDPLRELRGGTSYVSAPPLPNSPSPFASTQVQVQSGAGGDASSPDAQIQGQTARQSAPQGAPAQNQQQSGRPSASGPSLSAQSHRPPNMPSMVVRAAPINGTSPLSRAEKRRAERAEAARQNSHMLAPIKLDTSRTVQSAVSKMSPEAAQTPADWSTVAKINVPGVAGSPAIAQAISSLKRSSWGATSGASASGGRQNADGIHPDPMVRFANEHARKRQALDVLFDRFARIEAMPLATAIRAAPMQSMPVPPRPRTVALPHRNAFQ